MWWVLVGVGGAEVAVAVALGWWAMALRRQERAMDEKYNMAIRRARFINRLDKALQGTQEV